MGRENGRSDNITRLKRRLIEKRIQKYENEREQLLQKIDEQSKANPNATISIELEANVTASQRVDPVTGEKTRGITVRLNDGNLQMNFSGGKLVETAVHYKDDVKSGKDIPIVNGKRIESSTKIPKRKNKSSVTTYSAVAQVLLEKFGPPSSDKSAPAEPDLAKPDAQSLKMPGAHDMKKKIPTPTLESLPLTVANNADENLENVNKKKKKKRTNSKSDSLLTETKQVKEELEIVQEMKNNIQKEKSDAIKKEENKTDTLKSDSEPTVAKDVKESSGAVKKEKKKTDALKPDLEPTVAKDVKQSSGAVKKKKKKLKSDLEPTVAKDVKESSGAVKKKKKKADALKSDAEPTVAKDVKESSGAVKKKITDAQKSDSEPTVAKDVKQSSGAVKKEEKKPDALKSNSASRVAKDFNDNLIPSPKSVVETGKTKSLSQVITQFPQRHGVVLVDKSTSTTMSDEENSQGKASFPGIFELTEEQIREQQILARYVYVERIHQKYVKENPNVILHWRHQLLSYFNYPPIQARLIHYFENVVMMGKSMPLVIMGMQAFLDFITTRIYLVLELSVYFKLETMGNAKTKALMVAYQPEVEFNYEDSASCPMFENSNTRKEIVRQISVYLKARTRDDIDLVAKEWETWRNEELEPIRKRYASKAIGKKKPDPIKVPTQYKFYSLYDDDLLPDIKTEIAQFQADANDIGYTWWVKYYLNGNLYQLHPGVIPDRNSMGNRNDKP